MSGKLKSSKYIKTGMKSGFSGKKNGKILNFSITKWTTFSQNILKAAYHLVVISEARKFVS